MTKYRGLFHYLGTRYSGWQIQKNRPTVQEEVQKALARVTGETASVVAAGRTDSGVHARGQVVHFRLSRRQSPRRLLRAVNGVLKPDIRVMSLRRASPEFHAQKSARRKLYVYSMFCGPVLPPFDAGRVLHVRHPLDTTYMKAAAQELLGRHDFSAFAAASTGVKTRTRTLFRSSIRKHGRSLHYRVEGDGFLHHMVRNIVGTLLEIGKGKRHAEDIPALLAARDRRLAGPTAPAHGLTLMRVYY